MGKIVPVEAGAEAFVELLNANGMDYIFLNPGTDTMPIQLAIIFWGVFSNLRLAIGLCEI